MGMENLILGALLIAVGLLGTRNYVRDPKGRDSKFYLAVGLFGLILGIFNVLCWLAIETRMIT